MYLNPEHLAATGRNDNGGQYSLVRNNLHLEVRVLPRTGGLDDRWSRSLFNERDQIVGRDAEGSA